MRDWQRKKEVKNNNIWLKFWFYFMCEIKQQPYPYIWLEFKVLLEMWGTGGFVGRKFLFSLSWRKRKQSDLLRLSLYPERCVYDLCSNGILSDTMGAGDTPRLPTDDAGSNKQKQSNFFLLSYPLYHSRHYLHNSVWPSSSFLDTAPIFAHRGFRAKSISQQLILIIHNRSLQHPRRVGAADPDKLSRVNPTRSLSGLTKWSN